MMRPGGSSHALRSLHDMGAVLFMYREIPLPRDAECNNMS